MNHIYCIKRQRPKLPRYSARIATQTDTGFRLETSDGKHAIQSKGQAGRRRNFSLLGMGKFIGEACEPAVSPLFLQFEIQPVRIGAYSNRGGAQHNSGKNYETVA